MTRLFFLVLTGVLSTSNMFAQSGSVFKFKTTQAVMVDNNLKKTFLSGVSYHTFDLVNKKVILKTIDSQGTHTWNFKIISSGYDGDVYRFQVTSTDLPGIDEIFFNPNLPFIHYDSKRDNVTITHGGLTKIQ